MCSSDLNKERKGGKFPTREDVRNALEDKLIELKQTNITPNVFTFAGNGEPTVHPDFKNIIDDTILLRNEYFPEAKISVLSNSTQINKQSVFDALKKVDNNILKLDSAISDTVKLIDAPNQPNFDINNIVEKMSEFNGDLIVQTMFLRGNHKGKVVN